MESISKHAVVLDTNIIFDHWFLDTPYFNLLERAPNLDILEIYIPEVVLLEVKSTYRRRLREYFNYEKIPTMTKKLDIKLPSPEQICQKYEEFLKRKIANSSFNILNINEHINIKKLLMKSIKGKKPFKGTSEKGFKDELIWQTIINTLLVKKYKVYFITNNTNDFCQGSQLHPDLKKELQDLGIPKDNCLIYTSLKSFVNEQISPRFEKAKRFISGFDLKNWILDNISFLYDKITVQCDPFNFDIEEPELVEISYVGEAYIDNAYYLDENCKQIFIHATAEVQTTLDAFLSKHNYYGLDNERALISVMDEDWSDHYVWIQIHPEASLDISFILNIKTNEVISFEGILTCYEIYDFCKHCSAPLYSDAVEVCPNCGKNLF